MKNAAKLLIAVIILFSTGGIAQSFTPRTIGFNVGIMDPYPSPVGFGMSYYFDKFVGISALTGIRSLSDSRLTTFTAGFRFVATREKISPTAFLGLSTFETEQGTRMGVGFLGIGLNLAVSDNTYLGAGANFGLTPRDGKTETVPYFQFGVAY